MNYNMLSSINQLNKSMVMVALEVVEVQNLHHYKIYQTNMISMPTK